MEESVNARLFFRKEVENPHRLMIVGHARLRLPNEKGMLLRHARDSRGVYSLRLETMAPGFLVKTTTDQLCESAHVHRFGAPSMCLVSALPSLRDALRLKFIRTDWHLLAPAHTLLPFAIHVFRLPSHHQAIERDRHLAVATRLQSQYHHHAKRFPTVNAHLRLPVGANHLLSARGMISAMGLLQPLGQTHRWLDLKGQIIKMGIHVVLRMALAGLTLMDPTLASHRQCHRRLRFPCLLTTGQPWHLFSLPPPAHAAVHLSAERAPEMVHTAHRNPAAVIPPTRPTMAPLHATITTNPVPATALHVTIITIIVLTRALL